MHAMDAKVQGIEPSIFIFEHAPNRFEIFLIWSHFKKVQGVETPFFTFEHVPNSFEIF